MTRSNVENVRDALIDEFSKIKRANGFRNDVMEVCCATREVEQMTISPVISVVLGKEELIPRDQSCTLFDSTVTVTIIGYLKTQTMPEIGELLSEQAESLLHDMKRVAASLMTFNINNPATQSIQWIINPERAPIIFHRYFNYSSSAASISLQFQVIVQNQDASFND